MKNLILLTLITLSFIGCKDELTEAETIANLVEQRWTPASDCECTTECNSEYLEISSTRICYKNPNFPFDETVDCHGLTQSNEDPNAYVDDGGVEDVTVVEVSETDITLRFNYGSSGFCIFKGIR